MQSRRIVGLVISNPWGRFFEIVLSGIQQVFREHQIDILTLAMTPEEVARTHIAEDRVVGWLVLVFGPGIDLLARQGKPMVMISTPAQGLNHPVVSADNHAGITEVMTHLFEGGHSKIAFIGYTPVGDMQERFEAYQRALERQGIRFDPALVVHTEDALVEGGVQAIRTLLASGASFTAIVAGNDANAIGAMQELQAQGRRIPDDIALVGFDDVPEAQMTNPTLSTVRQRFDILGRQAATLLVDQLNGKPVQPDVYYTPTVFVPRQSSMPQQQAPTDPAMAPAIVIETDWQTALLQTLMQIVSIDGAFVVSANPVQIQNVVAQFIHLFGAFIEGRLEVNELDQSLVAIFANFSQFNLSINVVQEMLRLAHIYGDPVSKGRTDSVQSQQRLDMFIGKAFTEVLQSYRRRYDARNRSIDHDMTALYRISRRLLAESPLLLEWLGETPLMGGCLARWVEDRHQDMLEVVGTYHRTSEPTARIGTRIAAPHFPPPEALPQFDPDTDTHIVVKVQTANHTYGVLVVSGQFVPDDPAIMDQSSQMLEVVRTLLASALERELLQESLHQSLNNERALAQQVIELGSPVIPLMDGVLLIPLIGTIDPLRAQNIISAVLEGITAQQASDVVIDISGVPMLDTQAVQVLIQTAQAALLLGAQVTLVGIRPEIAQSIVSLGIDLQRIQKRPTLAAAIAALTQARSSSIG